MSVNATAVWRVRPSGSNTNGGGYDAAISGAGTDYSQQNAAQLTVSDAACVTGGTTVTSVTGGFTTAMIGNAMRLSGTNFTTGYYFITARTNTNTVSIDRDPTTGSNGSAGTCKVGGGWADFWTNTSTASPLVPGNIVYILGSGTPNPASYTYDYSPPGGGTSGMPSGDTTDGRIVYANDPSTPGYKAPPDTTGGMPVIKSAGYIIYGFNYAAFNGLWIVCSNAGQNFTGGINWVFLGCVLDQFGFDGSLTDGGISGMQVLGCEIYSSSGGSGGSNAAVQMLGSPVDSAVRSCNVHDTVGNGIIVINTANIEACIVAKCSGFGIKVSLSSGTTIGLNLINNTIDANGGNGIEFSSQTALARTAVYSNIISNHAGVGTFGIVVDAGTTAQNDRIKAFVDYNVFYNNASDLSAISYGTHDTYGGSNPYVGQSTENYTLA